MIAEAMGTLPFSPPRSGGGAAAVRRGAVPRTPHRRRGQHRGRTGPCPALTAWPLSLGPSPGLRASRPGAYNG